MSPKRAKTSILRYYIVWYSLQFPFDKSHCRWSLWTIAHYNIKHSWLNCPKTWIISLFPLFSGTSQLDERRNQTHWKSRVSSSWQRFQRQLWERLSYCITSGMCLSLLITNIVHKYRYLDKELWQWLWQRYWYYNITPYHDDLPYDLAILGPIMCQDTSIYHYVHKQNLKSCIFCRINMESTV